MEKYIKLLMKYNAHYFVYIVIFLSEYNVATLSPSFDMDGYFFAEDWMRKMTHN